MRSYLLQNFFVVLLFLPLLFTCSGTLPPEEEIVIYLDEAVRLVEKKSISGLRKQIADNYVDDSGMQKSDILRIASGYFLRNQTLNVTYSLKNLQITENDHLATMTVYAAVSETKLTSDDPRLLQAKFHRLDLRLEKQDEWLLKSIIWRTSNYDDFSKAAR